MTLRDDASAMETPGKRAMPGTTYAALASALVGLAAALMLVELSVTPPTTNKEVRVWKVVTGMTSSGDWLVPRIDGRPHFTKPPLYYWAAAAASKAAGETTLLTFRLPSVLAGIGVLVIVLLWSNQIAGPRVSLLAGALLAAMARFVAWARMGTFEMMLAFFSLAALYVFHLAYEGGRRRPVPLFYALFALAALTKGTAAIAVAGVPVAAWMALNRSMGPFKSRSSLACLAAALVAGTSWFALMAWTQPEARQVFAEEAAIPLAYSAARTATTQHKEPFYFYLPALVEITFPAALLLPLVLRRAWKGRGWRGNRGMRFLLVAAVSIAVFFSLLAGKQRHYILPVFAPLAILTAESVVWGVERAERFTGGALKASAGIWTGALVLVAGYPAFFGVVILGWPAWEAALGSATLIVCGAGLALSARRGRWRRAAAFAAAGTWALYLIVFGSYMTWHDQFQASTAALRPDYSAARWDANFQRYPWLKRVFREGKHDRFVMPAPKS